MRAISPCTPHLHRDAERHVKLEQRPDMGFAEAALAIGREGPGHAVVEPLTEADGEGDIVGAARVAQVFEQGKIQLGFRPCQMAAQMIQSLVDEVIERALLPLLWCRLAGETARVVRQFGGAIPAPGDAAAAMQRMKGAGRSHGSPRSECRRHAGGRRAR